MSTSDLFSRVINVVYLGSVVCITIAKIEIQLFKYKSSWTDMFLSWIKWIFFRIRRVGFVNEESWLRAVRFIMWSKKISSERA